MALEFAVSAIVGALAAILMAAHAAAVHAQAGDESCGASLPQNDALGSVCLGAICEKSCPGPYYRATNE